MGCTQIRPILKWAPYRANFYLSDPESFSLHFFRGTRRDTGLVPPKEMKAKAPGITEIKICPFCSTLSIPNIRYTAPTPREHTLQQMGLVVTKAFGLHLRNSTRKMGTEHRDPLDMTMVNDIGVPESECLDSPITLPLEG